jgi:hypothetical protein
MTKLTIEKLSKDLHFFSGYVAEVEVEFVSSNYDQISDFLDKYDTVQLVSAWSDTFLLKVYGSGEKQVKQLCAIIEEEYNVLSVEIVSLSEV